jgi:hypothetical protein
MSGQLLVNPKSGYQPGIHANETKPRLIAMAKLQSQLERAVFAGLEKNFWSKALNRLMLALALLLGMLIGGGIIVLAPRVLPP